MTWWQSVSLEWSNSSLYKRMFPFGTSHGYASLLQQRRHTRSVTVDSTRPPSCVTLPYLLSIVSEHPLHTSIKYWNDIVSRQHFINHHHHHHVSTADMSLVTFDFSQMRTRELTTKMLMTLTVTMMLLKVVCSKSLLSKCMSSKWSENDVFLSATVMFIFCFDITQSEMK